MKKFNTNNPLGSIDPRDLYDNARSMDHAVNETEATTWVDRFGKHRLTWKGITDAGTGDPSTAVEAADRALGYADTAKGHADTSKIYAEASQASSSASASSANRSEAAAAIAVSSVGSAYGTRAQMNADSSRPDGTWAIVVNDGNAQNNGYYIREDSTWVRTELQPSSGDFQAAATYAENWNAISKSGVYRSNLNGNISEGSPGFPHMAVFHVEQGTNEFDQGGRAWQSAMRRTGENTPIHYTRVRNSDGVWSEWEEIATSAQVSGAVVSSSELSDQKSAGIALDSFAIMQPDGSFTQTGTWFSNSGPVVVSEEGYSLLTRVKFTPRERVFLVYVRAWGSPEKTDLSVMALGYNSQADQIVNSVPLGSIPSDQTEGVFVFDSSALGGAVWGLAVQSASSNRFVVASMAVKPFEGVYKGEDIKVTARAVKDTAYQNVALFGLDQTFDINRNNLDISSDYIGRTQSGSGPALSSRQAILKRGRSFQVIASNASEETGVLLHQHATSVPGRVQMYVNRGAPTGFLEDHVNLYIEGVEPQLPPMPIIPGEKFSVTINIDDEDNVELYYGTRLWGRGLASNGIADVPMGILGGGLTARDRTRIYSISCVDYADRDLHLASAIPNPYLVSNAYFTENTGRYACVTPDGVIRSRSPREVLPPASLTKVLSALVILDRANLTDLVEVLAEDATTGSGNNLLTGDVISVEDLLYDMMLPSSNVAASVAARHVGGDVETFVSWLNEKAQYLGMDSSFFLNPHGLSAEGQVTNAKDMLILCKTASNYIKLQEIWSAPSRTITITGPNARVMNVTSSVQMIGDEGVLGGKTGTLSGGYNHLMIHAKTPDGTPFWGVVMGASTNTNRYFGMREAFEASRSVACREVMV